MIKNQMQFLKKIIAKNRQDPHLPRSKALIKTLKRPRNKTNIDLLHPIWNDLYHWLLSIPWLQFLLLITIIYIAVNFLFALAYLAGGEGIANARAGSLIDAFFFSIQTLSTVGYGSMYPATLYTQIVVTLEILVGLVLIAILTGLMFARFSRPTARVLFSDVAVICPYNGIKTLMFRTANRRDSHILEAQVQVSFLRNEVSIEGHQLRRFYNLNLVRSQTPVFGLSWLIMHPIDENSPLYQTTGGQLEDMDAEIWVTLTGIDETFAQTIHARHSYTVSELHWDVRFVDIFSTRANGERFIDLLRFHDITPL